MRNFSNKYAALLDIAYSNGIIRSVVIKLNTTLIKKAVHTTEKRCGFCLFRIAASKKVLVYPL